MYLFIHIPKTAGTSFRQSAEHYFGSANVICDYGIEAQETHYSVKKYIYESYEPYDFFIKLNAMSGRMLCGHVPIQKYAPLYNSRNIITFMRRPDQQIRSHFEHVVRHKNYEKSFIEFLQDARAVNMQSRYLNHLPLQSIGFVGITEFYQESIAVINQLYGFSMLNFHLNSNNEKKSSDYEFSVEELELIEKLNKKDYELYQRALFLFNRKKVAIEQRSEFLILGEIPRNLKINQTHIQGWMLDLKGSNSAKGKVVINGKEEFMFLATKYSGWISQFLEHRKGYFGYSVHLKKGLKSGDCIDLIDERNQIVDSIVID